MDFTGLSSYGTPTSNQWEGRSIGGNALGGSSFGSNAYLPSPVLSGVAVTPETALTCTAVFACINALSTDLASLPREIKRKRPGKGRTPVPNDKRYNMVYCEPNRNTTSFRFYQSLYSHRFGWGNGFAEVKRDSSGMPGEMHLHSPRPTDTWAEKSRNGSIWYMLDAGRRHIRAEDMLHLAGLGFNGLTGYSAIALHRQAVGYALAMEQQGAAFYGNAATPKGALKVERHLSPEAMRNLRESIASVHSGPENAHRLLILEEGMQYQQISISPEDAEYILSRQFQIIEICRMFRVPPPRIMDYSGVTGVYKAFSDLIDDYISSTLGPEVEGEQQWSNKVFFTRRERAHGLHLAHDFTSLTRGNLAARAAYYEKRFALGSITGDEIREREGDNPTDSPHGKQFFVSSSYRPAEAPNPVTAAAPTDPPIETETEAEGDAATGAES